MLSKANTILLIGLLCAAASNAQASASLPRLHLDLAVLDLNNAPFRYFHLSYYRGGILNIKRYPTRPMPLHEINISNGIKLDQFNLMTGLFLPRIRYAPFNSDIPKFSSNVSIDSFNIEQKALPF